MFFKNKIKFYCNLPEVREKYPITQSKNQKYSWFKKSALNFKKMATEIGRYQQVTGVSRCPGIRSILNKGFILRSWFDLTIKPIANGQGMEYYVPEGVYSYLKERNFNDKVISCFTPENNAHMIPLNKNQLQALVKITTSWSVFLPNNKDLLIMPVPYSDNTDFTPVHGVLNSGSFNEINAIIKINHIDKEFTIPAGTPLLQLIPVDTCEYGFEINDFDEKIANVAKKNKFESNNTFIVKK
jgi:hypothetical protein